MRTVCQNAPLQKRTTKKCPPQLSNLLQNAPVQKRTSKKRTPQLSHLLQNALTKNAPIAKCTHQILDSIVYINLILKLLFNLGTFKITPALWYQTFIILAEIQEKNWIPCVYALLPNKRGETYASCLFCCRVDRIILFPSSRVQMLICTTQQGSQR